jgi:hypothetical protein
MASASVEFVSRANSTRSEMECQCNKTRPQESSGFILESREMIELNFRSLRPQCCQVFTLHRLSGCFISRSFSLVFTFNVAIDFPKVICLVNRSQPITDRVLLKGGMPFCGQAGPHCGIGRNESSLAVQMPATAGEIGKIAGIMAIAAAILFAILNRT